MIPPQFSIDDEYITSVTVVKELCFLEDRNNPTPEDTIKILKGYHRGSITSHKDHDEFTKLRDQLEELGYIRTARNYWNGDTVLKPFKLNEWTFKKNQRFLSAGALRSSIDWARKSGRKTLDLL